MESFGCTEASPGDWDLKGVVTVTGVLQSLSEFQTFWIDIDVSGSNAKSTEDWEIMLTSELDADIMLVHCPLAARKQVTLILDMWTETFENSI